MAKKVINEVADVIAKQRKLMPKDVEAFISAMFRNMAEGLDKDRLVKVKGLGTFKVMSVKPRESVNVNTGERVIIESHDKITFTPDASMRDLVNKPFSQFETVVLNENVDFADVEHEASANENATDTSVTDIPEEKAVQATDASVVEKQTPSIGMNKPVEEVRETVDVVRTDIKETENTDAYEGKHEETQVDMQEENSGIVVETVEKTAPTIEKNVAPKENILQETVLNDDIYDNVEDNQKKRPFYIYGLVAVALVLCFIAGIYAGPFVSNMFNSEKPAAVTAQNQSTTDKKQVKENQVTTKPEVKPMAQAAQSVSQATDNSLDFDKMNADVRVKYGAYKIVGVDTIITLKQGQTMTSYCRATLGSGMLCYFQVLNDAEELGEGDKLKVPKVKVKKSSSSVN